MQMKGPTTILTIITQVPSTLIKMMTLMTISINLNFPRTQLPPTILLAVFTDQLVKLMRAVSTITSTTRSNTGTSY